MHLGRCYVDPIKDILLSSIATAKKQLKPNEIDTVFVQQAFALKNGEKLARFGY